MDAITYAMAKKYTDDSLVGVGALAGAPCTVDSVTDITSSGAVIGQKTTFAWEDSNGDEHTTDMDIMYEDIAAMVLAQLPTAESIEV